MHLPTSPAWIRDSSSFVWLYQSLVVFFFLLFWVLHLFLLSVMGY